jgi:hypothetical protein
VGALALTWIRAERAAADSVYRLPAKRFMIRRCALRSFCCCAWNDACGLFLGG